ncbi:MAG: GFA family protein [Kiloniellales bacterium]|nr:GFA family protein [Kiloniellales bacterium]
MSFTGGCLCGAVRYQGREQRGGGHCHCIDCRKTSGTGHGSHMIVPEAAFSISGELRFFDAPADSGNMVSRGFCPTCGSAIYSRNSAVPGLVFVRASSLDDPEVFRPQLVVYAKRGPSWDRMDPALPSFEEMPPPEEMPDMAE